MKKSTIQFSIWAGVAYLFLYLASRAMLALNRNNDLHFEPGGIFKQYLLIILIYLVLGGLIGIFARIIRRAPVLTYILAILYGLYFSVEIFFYYSLPFAADLMYPSWMFQNALNMTMSFGSMILGLTLLEIFKGKALNFKWLKKGLDLLIKYKWRLLLLVILGSTVSVVVYTPPQEKVVNECMELMYSVPTSDYIYEIGENERQVYAELCTEQAYTNIVGRDLYKLFAKAGNREGFSIELKNLNLETGMELPSQGRKERMYYNYEAELLLTFDGNGKTETLYERGSINLEKEDGKWRVTNIGFKDVNEIFK